MSAIASQITSLTIVFSVVYSDVDQRKHQSSASLAFVWGIHRGPVNSPQMASYAENVSIWWRHHVAPFANMRWQAYVIMVAADNLVTNGRKVTLQLTCWLYGEHKTTRIIPRNIHIARSNTQQTHNVINT